MWWWIACQLAPGSVYPSPSTSPSTADPPTVSGGAGGEIGPTLGLPMEGSSPEILLDLDGDAADDLVTRLSAGDVEGLAVVSDWVGGSPAYLLSATSVTRTDEYGSRTGLEYALPAGDLTGDGVHDLWVAGVDGPLRLIPGPLAPNEPDVVARAVGEVTTGLPRGPIDADADGHDDLVLGSALGLHVCTGPFAAVPDPATCPTRTEPAWESTWISAFGDLDGDGIPEVLVGGGDGEMLAVPGDDPLAVPALRVAAELNASAADLDGDGWADLLWDNRFGTFGPFAPGALVDGTTVDATFTDEWAALDVASQAGADTVLVQEVVYTTGATPVFGVVDVSSGGTFGGRDVLWLHPEGTPVTFGVGDLDADGVDDVFLADGAGLGWLFSGSSF
jgi:hypothetical protein